jgi:hypothetical protein
VPHHRGQLKKAPNVEPDGHLSEAEEAELYRHYGLDYDTVTLDDDAAAAQPRAAAAGRPDDPGRNQQGEASSPEPASDRPNAQDEPSATAGSQPAGPAGQDRFPVGEGVSRPFVYETPGRPAGGASNLRRQPGQMRLRRYLVTEVVTDTGSGQRHEVRVHSEPVPDARVDVDEVLTSPDRQDGLPGQEPTEPDRNDWFSDETEPPR